MSFIGSGKRIKEPDFGGGITLQRGNSSVDGGVLGASRIDWTALVRSTAAKKGDGEGFSSPVVSRGLCLTRGPGKARLDAMTRGWCGRCRRGMGGPSVYYSYPTDAGLCRRSKDRWTGTDRSGGSHIRGTQASTCWARTIAAGGLMLMFDFNWTIFRCLQHTRAGNRRGSDECRIESVL